MPIKSPIQEVIEVTGVNATILSVTTFSNIETALKILLLVISIIYTLDKYIHHRKSKNGKK
jgi:hypothetical protein